MGLDESGFLKTGTDNIYLDGGSISTKNGHVGKRIKRRKNRRMYDVADTQEKVPLKNEMGHYGWSRFQTLAPTGPFCCFVFSGGTLRLFIL